MRLLIVIAVFLLSLLKINAQTGTGKVEIIADDKLERAIQSRISQKKAKVEKVDTLIVQGYRIQIFFGNDRKKAYATRDNCIKLFPEYANEVYIVYQAPNYKVRVGNFIKESDAQNKQKPFARKFENVFIVRDRVKYIKNKPKETTDD